MNLPHLLASAWSGDFLASTKTRSDEKQIFHLLSAPMQGLLFFIWLGNFCTYRRAGTHRLLLFTYAIHKYFLFVSSGIWHIFPYSSFAKCCGHRECPSVLRSRTHKRSYVFALSFLFGNKGMLLKVFTFLSLWSYFKCSLRSYLIICNNLISFLVLLYLNILSLFIPNFIVSSQYIYLIFFNQ